MKHMSISVIVSFFIETETMPRLSAQQREQAIGRLHAGQSKSHC